MRQLTLAALLLAAPASAAVPVSAVNTQADAVEAKVIDWRRDIHQHPELGNREVRTAALVAKHLRALGYEVREKVGVTGVVGILKGGKPGGVVALRADMDALPVKEATGLPFASQATGTYNGATVPVAHACGHDAHVAMLMGAAEVLAKLKADIPGTVVLVFQPAEEGPPAGEAGGASLMLKEGVFNAPKPQAIFGLHVWPGVAGSLSWRPGAMMAEADTVHITLKGVQTHGAVPWRGTDLIGQVATTVHEVNRLVTRTIDPTQTPTILTMSAINAGLRHNIIPDKAEIFGTMRSFDLARRDQLKEQLEKMVKGIAAVYGTEATVDISSAGALTYNEPALATWLSGPLAEATGSVDQIHPDAPPVTVSEDVSLFMNKVGGVYYFLGISPDGVAAGETPPNHSPFFTVNEKALKTGVKAHVLSAIRFLEQQPKRERPAS
ncbi:amidohydrolase [Sandaracinobacter neustonicus]|uniref:Amidohydrolase n=1 Tax=Sandaracinobacter neustonicus TaxID=1715348 RepID=A0A501XTS0_9SPHN|nr:amidohydrolase [Sandaracinobacter neustonicus]TPE63753.1 amidohydrolase [Sandaracinobacter neustonicus]